MCPRRPTRFEPASRGRALTAEVGLYEGGGLYYPSTDRRAGASCLRHLGRGGGAFGSSRRRARAYRPTSSRGLVGPEQCPRKRVKSTSAGGVDAWLSRSSSGTPWSWPTSRTATTPTP